MRLRAKFAALFILGFGLMIILALTLMQRRLHEGFLTIEQKQATEQMHQLSHNLNSELEKLTQATSDWSNWDDIYGYMQHPVSSFTDRQMNPIALKGIEVKFFALLDINGNTVFSEAVNLKTAELESIDGFNTTLNNVKKRLSLTTPGTDKACGLDMSAVGPLLICWQPVRKTDLSGYPIGTLVMARLLNSALINKIQIQSNIKFDLTPLASQEPKSPAAIKDQIVAENIEFSKKEPEMLNAVLVNIVGEPILKVSLEFSDYVSNKGAAITWTEVRLAALVILLVGLTIFAIVNSIFFGRLQKMEFELRSIWRNGRWAERLATPKRADELSELADAVNRMLGLIRKQTLVLETIAHTDSLTQIANRRAFEQRILIEMSLHNRNQTPLSLLLIDIDHFSLYNDQYGHPAGDDILIEVAKLLTQIACRPSDLPARIGGEEFAVILPATDLAGAVHVAQTLKSKLAKLQILHANSPTNDFLTVSIGVTAAGEEDLAGLMRRAEDAHNQARQSGRNTICALEPAGTGKTQET